MIIRKVEINDAEKVLDMLTKLDEETKFMLYEPGERKSTVEGMKKRISTDIDNNDLTLVIDDNGEIGGILSATKGNANRIRHSSYIVVGMRAKYRGNGIGKRMFEMLDQWAKEENVTRLELTVMVENIQAINLYTKMGFKIEGRKVNSCIVDGKYMDEYYMGKIIS